MLPAVQAAAVHHQWQACAGRLSVNVENIRIVCRVWVSVSLFPCCLASAHHCTSCIRHGQLCVFFNIAGAVAEQNRQDTALASLLTSSNKLSGQAQKDVKQKMELEA